MLVYGEISTIFYIGRNATEIVKIEINLLTLLHYISQQN